MSISIKQFLALPIDAKIVINKNAFVVKNLDQVEERMEPVLINVATGERLYGAIYVAHLMRVEGVVDLSKQKAGQDENHAVSPEVGDCHKTSEPAIEVSLPGDDVLSLCWESRSENVAQDDLGTLFFVPEVLVGRKEYAHKSDYEILLLE